MGRNPEIYLENDQLMEVVSDTFIPMKKEFEKVLCDEEVNKEFFTVVANKDISMIINDRN
jgi:hypothetical protein